MIEFDAASHTYRLDGKPVPNVTSILKPLVDYSRVPPGILEAARLRGQAVHEACHLLNQGDLDWSSLTPEVAVRVENYRRWIHDSKAEVIASEIRVASRKYRYAGTADLVIHLRRGGLTLADLKATVELPTAVGPQTAAYVQGCHETYGYRPLRRLCIRLSPTEYGHHPLNDPRDWSRFLSCRNLINT